MRVIYRKSLDPSTEIELSDIYLKAQNVLDNPPSTWVKYPETKQGALNILQMEANELMVTKDEHELIHVAAALMLVHKYLCGEVKDE